MKNHTLYAFIVLIVAAGPALGQKIETQPPSGPVITRVQTALNYLTVIQLSEPVTSVAAGSQAFKVEWRENKVFIEPTEPSVSTNLFIWTKSGRLNYELEPAGEVAQMDFAVDQPPIDPPHSMTPAAVAEPAHDPSMDVPALLGGKPVRISAYKAGGNRVQLLIKDLFQRDDQLFIRYAVENSTNHCYEVATPQVLFLDAPRGPRRLVQQHGTQLTDSEAGKIESKGQVPLPIICKEVRSVRVKPGEETVGVVGVKIPVAGDGATVLRVVLPDDGHGHPTATLVF
jgi:hypothetical protein